MTIASLTALTWVVFDFERRRQTGNSMRHRRLLLMLLLYDVTFRLLLLLGVRGVVVSRAPARVQLHMKLFLFASHLVVLGLLGAPEGMPLHSTDLSRCR